MRPSIATLTVASLMLVTASVAQATPTQVNVRIEGGSETLFEGPILTEGHDVEASSDTKERSCDGINVNDPENVIPGPTPTASAADALSLIGETFDGEWYPGFEDYLIKRWGPNKEENGESWGLVVNNVFTNVGGCQYQLSGGGEVLWVYNAFQHRPFLALYPVGDTSGAPPLTAIAELNKPFEVELLAYEDTAEGRPPPVPARTGSVAYKDGADVSPVQTAANGFETVETQSAETVKTNTEGKASITFTQPGWHRIKATALNAEGKEDAIRSNRLDVCVPERGSGGCGQPPTEDDVRTAPHTEEQRKAEEEAKRVEEAKQEEEAKEEEEARRREEEANVSPLRVPSSGVLAFKATSGENQPTASPARIQTPTLDGEGAAQGLVGVNWRILEPGVGLRSWSIASRALGSPGAGYVTRATGTIAASALLALPAGAAYELEITFTDVLGRTSTTQIGKALVPRDDRWSGLRYRGRWRHLKQSGAWLGTVSRGGAGAEVSARLGAGRPAFLLRGTEESAKVELRAGAARQVFAIARGSAGASRMVTGVERPDAGPVSLRVLKGTVDLDGVAVEP